MNPTLTPWRTGPWFVAWRLARHELSWRFSGLRLLIACLFLGVAALAATGSLTAAIQRGLADRGRLILGGDIEISVWQRPLTRQETAALSAQGTISIGTRLQAMATAGSGSGATTVPIELKSVDTNWPLVGRLTLTDGRQVGAPAPGTVWLSDGAAARLAVHPGDSITIAAHPLKVAGLIATEPDRLGEGFALGPTVIAPAAFPASAGLTAPGAMYHTKARLACAHTCNAATLANRLKAQFPAAGFEIRTRDHAAPGAESFLTHMGDFLVLVGLAALVIAGIGIGGGTASYLEARRPGIATLKVLGATGADIARIYAIEIGAAALAASLAGLLAGALAVPLLAQLLTGLLSGGAPADTALAPSLPALLRALAWGLLVALIFAAPPLAAARDIPAMALLRARIAPGARTKRKLPPATLPVTLGLTAILALAILGSSQPGLAAIFLAGAAILLTLLAALGLAIRALAAALPRPRAPIPALALANLHRPAAQTTRLVTALGFGLSAFVLLAVIETSLDAAIAHRVPARAPDYFVLDLPPARLAAFTTLIHASAPAAHIRSVPAMRGAILAYGPASHPTRVADLPAISDDAWALKGERGLTWSADIPEGNSLTEGQWWSPSYTGPPLVSVDDKLAHTLHLHLGDTITIGVLGVERTATIASFRRIDWDSLGFNYILVFSPSALSDAPHSLAATIVLAAPEKTPATKAALLHALTRAFPAISVIEVGPLLQSARDLLNQMSTAILAAASVAVLAGLAVLLGAIAAARAARAYDAVILRVLGASRAQLLTLILAEYGFLCALLAVVSLALGSALGWLVVVQLFGFDFLPNWPRVAEVLAAGLALILGFALAGSIPLLRTRPAEALREL
jgi:putative ABC transport system permease protein